MGKATIVENRGEGLYRVKIKYNHTREQAELDTLKAARDAYWAVLLRALKELDRLRSDARAAQGVLEAVVEQWIQFLLTKTAIPPPLEPPTEKDPETGEPWEDPDRAQEAAVFEAINAARLAASQPTLTRDAELNAAALGHARYLKGTDRLTHAGNGGSTPEQRVSIASYLAVAVGEVLTAGQVTAADAVAEWLRPDVAAATLLAANFEDIGIGYVYAPSRLGTHVWVAVLAQSGTPPPAELAPPKNPATEKAKEQEATLEKIPTPEAKPDVPKQLGTAAAKFAEAALKRNAAEAALVQMKLDALERDQRIAVLEKLFEHDDTIYDVWCANYHQLLTGTVDTIEVPGYWLDEPETREATIYKNTEDERMVSYHERSWNIAPDGSTSRDSYLHWAEGMSGAAIFVNLALEPGHLKWRPEFRYGTITAISAAGANVAMDAVSARKAKGEKTLSIRRDATLTAVPVEYMGSGWALFKVDDEVLVQFRGAERDQPVIIGFRREPVDDPQGRQTWGQPINPG